MESTHRPVTNGGEISCLAPYRGYLAFSFPPLRSGFFRVYHLFQQTNHHPSLYPRPPILPSPATGVKRLSSTCWARPFSVHCCSTFSLRSSIAARLARMHLPFPVWPSQLAWHEEQRPNLNKLQHVVPCIHTFRCTALAYACAFTYHTFLLIIIAILSIADTWSTCPTKG